MNHAETSPLALHCVGLSKAFDGLRAVNFVDMAFERSKITAIVGPNGAGKTTLLNLLTGFLPADGGQVFLANQEITSFSPFQIARLGMVRSFQSVRLFRNQSAFENVLLSRPSWAVEGLLSALSGSYRKRLRKDREQAMHWLHTVGLKEQAGVVSADLSYGQQKLLSLACCMASEATVLMLDEPAAGVHPELLERVVTLFRSMRARGITIVLIEHDLELVRKLADSVAVMAAGQTVAVGSPAEVLESRAVSEAFLA